MQVEIGKAGLRSKTSKYRHQNRILSLSGPQMLSRSLTTKLHSKIFFFSVSGCPASAATATPESQREMTLNIDRECCTMLCKSQALHNHLKSINTFHLKGLFLSFTYLKSEYYHTFQNLFWRQIHQYGKGI